MDEDWNDKFFSELSVNTIGILSWDDGNHQWIVSTYDNTLGSNHHHPCNGMIWDSSTLTWKGNDVDLETFNFES